MSTTMKQPTMRSDKENQLSAATLFLFVGIALVVFGCAAIASSFVFTIGTVVLIGGLMIAAGLTELINAFRGHDRKQSLLNILSAIIYLVAGGLTMFHPLAGALGLTLIISGFLFGSGVMRCWDSIKHRESGQWGWFLLGGIANIAMGILIAAHWPTTALWLIGLFIGVEMLIHGIGWISLAAATRKAIAQS